MKFLLRAFALIGLLSACAAQTVSFESVRLAETFVASQWQSVEQSLPVLVAGIQSQIKSTGATDTASKVFAAELRRSMSKDNLTKAMAQALTQNFSEEEQRELGVFTRSNLGQKFLQFNRDATTNPRYIAPILKQACVATTQQLGTADRSSISGTCGQF